MFSTTTSEPSAISPIPIARPPNVSEVGGKPRSLHHQGKVINGVTNNDTVTTTALRVWPRKRKNTSVTNTTLLSKHHARYGSPHGPVRCDRNRGTTLRPSGKSPSC